MHKTKNAKYAQCVYTLLSIMIIQATNKVNGSPSVTSSNGKGDGIPVEFEFANQETKTERDLTYNKR